MNASPSPIRGTLRSGRPAATIPARPTAPTGRGPGVQVASAERNAERPSDVDVKNATPGRASGPVTDDLGEDAHLMPDRSLRLTLPTGAVLPREGRPTPPSPPSK